MVSDVSAFIEKNALRCGKLFIDLCLELALREGIKRLDLPLAPDTPEDRRRSRAKWREYWELLNETRELKGTRLTAADKRSIRYSMTRIGRNML